jgi:competence protein ComEC
LSATLIDVGWGDSIFLKFEDDNNTFYGLIDSNDTTYYLSSFIFIKRYLEKYDPDAIKREKLFEFVVLTHAHADHGQGLKKIIREWGTKYFWFPKSASMATNIPVIQYANKTTKIDVHQSVNSNNIFPDFGQASMKVLWPPYNEISDNNENNNSIVFCLTYGKVSFVFTGDAEAEVWDKISDQIPDTTRFFKIPHHGSVNGSLINKNINTPAKWLSKISDDTELGVSCHVRPFSHPHKEVISLFKKRNKELYRTDENHHITALTDGSDINIKYSH